eukprot:3517921-Rhodomonas_salina.1
MAVVSAVGSDSKCCWMPKRTRGCDTRNRLRGISELLLRLGRRAITCPPSNVDSRMYASLNNPLRTPRCVSTTHHTGTTTLSPVPDIA